MSRLKICVLGLGYVGLPLVLNISKKFECISFDLNKERIKNLKKKLILIKSILKKILITRN